MIKANELRIGNYLQTKDFKLTSITDIWLINIKSDQEIYTFYCFGYKQDEVIPILLNEEWLLKLGFQNCNGGLTPDYNFNGIEINFERFLEASFYSYNEVAKFQYVHQLQNLYYALTGEELTIK
jgi:hypothetical protein